MTLRLHVPHHLLPADQCAEHGPQENGPAAGKGHTDEPTDWAHTQHAVTDQIQRVRGRVCPLCLNLSEGTHGQPAATWVPFVMCPCAYLTIKIYLMAPAQIHRCQQALTHTAMKAHAPEAPHTVIKPYTLAHAHMHALHILHHEAAVPFQLSAFSRRQSSLTFR